MTIYDLLFDTLQIAEVWVDLLSFIPLRSPNSNRKIVNALVFMAEKELTFWDHLDELRRVLFRVLGVWFVLAIGYFIAMPYLFDNVILAPCHNDFVSMTCSVG